VRNLFTVKTDSDDGIVPAISPTVAPFERRRILFLDKVRSVKKTLVTELKGPTASVSGRRCQKPRALSPRQSAIGEKNFGDGAARDQRHRLAGDGVKSQGPCPLDKVRSVKKTLATELQGINGIG